MCYLTADEQIIGAKAESATFIMRDLHQLASLSASLNSVVGHLAIINARYLADYLESVSKAKQRERRLFSCYNSPNVFSFVSFIAGAFGVLFRFHK